jgi:hypothetical protein
MMHLSDAAAVATHLRGGCDRCEDVLGSMPGEPVDLILAVTDDARPVEAELSPEAIDAAFEAVMARAGEAKAGEGDDHRRLPWYEALPFEHRVATGSHTHARPPRRRQGLAAALGLAAAAAVALVLWVPGPTDAPVDGVKGAAPAVDLSVPDVGISFVVARNSKVIRPGRDGDSVPVDADLLFRFRVEGGPAHIYLVREAAGRRTVVWPAPGSPSERVLGEVDLKVDGVVHGVSLGGLSGPVSFEAVASARPLEHPEAARQPGRHVSRDALTVHVRAEQP